MSGTRPILYNFRFKHNFSSVFCLQAHYMLGLALLQGKQYGNAISELEKAFDLGRTGKSGSYMVEEIWQELAKAHYTEWEQAASVQQHQQQELK
jgi:STIP1 family protein 1